MSVAVPADHQIYLNLGSNIDPEENLLRALKILNRCVQIEALSSVWETPAVGSFGPNFLNLTVRIRSSLPHESLKQDILRNIEAQLGRKRTPDKNSPRPIDIDIVLADGEIIDRQIWHQAHLALPLAELVPDTERTDGPRESLKQAGERLSAAIPGCKRSDMDIKLNEWLSSEYP